MTEVPRPPVRSGRWLRLGRRLLAPFPEVSGNAVEPLALGGDAYFGSMLQAIAGARESVAVQMYLWDDDDLGRKFLDALREAAERGARVRVLVDAFGAREVTGAPLARVAAGGAEVRAFNAFRFDWLTRFHHRTHKKSLIVDRRLAFVGGAGFSLYFSRGKHRERPWHDRMFALRGPVVHQLVDTFDVDFSRWGPRGEPVERTLHDAGAPIDAGPSRGRVLRGWPDTRDFPRALLGAVRDARDVIRIGTPYFVPRLRLLRSLADALRRGVRVELVVPSYQWSHPVLWYAARRYVGTLLQRGAAVYYYSPSFYHAKIAVVDDAHAFIGSSNIDGWSWRSNAELDLEFRDPATVTQLARCFEDDRENSAPLTSAAHRAAGLHHRAYQGAARLLARWM